LKALEKALRIVLKSLSKAFNRLVKGSLFQFFKKPLKFL